MFLCNCGSFVNNPQVVTFKIESVDIHPGDIHFFQQFLVEYLVSKSEGFCKILIVLYCLYSKVFPFNIYSDFCLNVLNCSVPGLKIICGTGISLLIWNPCLLSINSSQSFYSGFRS